MRFEKNKKNLVFPHSFHVHIAQFGLYLPPKFYVRKRGIRENHIVTFNFLEIDKRIIFGISERFKYFYNTQSSAWN